MSMKYRWLLHRWIYTDRADIYRGKAIPKGALDDYDSELELVYKDIPCKLGFYRYNNHAERTARSMVVDEDYRLDCDPEYDIRNNDVAVIRHVGQEFRMYVGNVLNYATHKEATVKIRREAGR